MIGTAKNPNSKGFDLFITTAPIPNLNEKLVVFGRVINGEDIVQVLSEILYGSFIQLFAFIVLKNDDGQGRRIRGSDTQ
jgi:cyclophilin family peptidyl-prolyl cis-trans isomerase